MAHPFLCELKQCPQFSIIYILKKCFTTSSAEQLLTNKELQEDVKNNFKFCK